MRPEITFLTVIGTQSTSNIQIKIALSVNKVHILIKILAESHVTFDLGDKIDIR